MKREESIDKIIQVNNVNIHVAQGITSQTDRYGCEASNKGYRHFHLFVQQNRKRHTEPDSIAFVCLLLYSQL